MLTQVTDDGKLLLVAGVMGLVIWLVMTLGQRLFSVAMTESVQFTNTRTSTTATAPTASAMTTARYNYSPIVASF